MTARTIGENVPGPICIGQADSIKAVRDDIRDPVRGHFAAAEGTSVMRVHDVGDEVLAA